MLALDWAVLTAMGVRVGLAAALFVMLAPGRLHPAATTEPAE
jgi:hypothetical protein